jgi:hypothetical protein
LVSVRLFEALAVFRGCGPKLRDVAESRTAVPMPLKLTVCGLLGSLSAMTRVAERIPAAVGLNAKLIVQLPSAVTPTPAIQELDSIVKSPAAVPVGVGGAKLPQVGEGSKLQSLSPQAGGLVAWTSIR